MKAFWWQGGLHFEPETPEEGNAMRLLYDSTKKSSIGAEGSGSGPKQPGCGAHLSLESSELAKDAVEPLIGNH